MPASQNRFAPELNEKEVIELLEDHIMIIYVDLHMYSALILIMTSWKIHYKFSQIVDEFF